MVFLLPSAALSSLFTLHMMIYNLSVGRYLCSGRIGKNKKTEEVTMPTDDVEFRWHESQVLSWSVFSSIHEEPYDELMMNL
jgi:hypothetical protein